MPDKILKYNNQLLAYEGSYIRTDRAAAPPPPVDPAIALFEFENDYVDSQGNYIMSAGGTGNTFGTGKVGTYDLDFGAAGFATTDISSNIFEGTNSFSTVMWVKCGSPTTYRFIGAVADSGAANLAGGYAIGASSLGRILFDRGLGGGLIATGNYCDSAWHMVAFIYDGATMYINVDNGSEIVSVGNATSIPARNNTVTMGRLGDYTAGLYYGDEIDQLRFFNYDITSGEINTLWNGGAGS